jgi:hypothetical protein
MYIYIYVHIVMTLANGGIQPRFNKYSGVCEWNNCAFLWVNISKGGGVNYNNQFNEKGRFITWFGGSKMAQDSGINIYISMHEYFY